MSEDTKDISKPNKLKGWTKFWFHLKKFLTFFVFLIIGVIYFTLVIGMGIKVILVTFGGDDPKTIDYSYLGFAFLAVTSNICFSWTRTYNTNSNIFKTIRYTGEIGLCAAILFIIASLLKYFLINAKITLDKETKTSLPIVVSFIRFFLRLFFILAYTLGCTCYGLILRILSGRFIKSRIPFIQEKNSFENITSAD